MRRAIVALAIVVAVVVAGVTTALRSSADPGVGERPNVLLVGDSVLDQEGSHAAFLLRQNGVDASAVGFWGSSLLTREQYDMGRSRPHADRPDKVHWLSIAPTLIDEEEPDLVAVALNYNYAEPYPRDATGREITDLRSPEGVAMIQTQARAFIDILAARGAQVVFVEALPSDAGVDADPYSAAIWAAYAPVLRERHVDVVSLDGVLADADGARVERERDCAGEQQLVRPEPGNVHLTRFGAGQVGTVLARKLAALVDHELDDNQAPGDRTVALVPTESGLGYWLVACDGSIAHFGDAFPLPRVEADQPIIGAAPAGDRGLWLVGANGRVEPAGDAAALTLEPALHDPIVAVSGTHARGGIIAVTARGGVAVAGDASRFGSASLPPERAAVGVVGNPQADGYWIATADGSVLAFGDAQPFGSAADLGVTSGVTGIAASPTGAGYRLVLHDGQSLAFGDASPDGAPQLSAAEPNRSEGEELFRAPGRPAAGAIVSAPSGYWTMRENGDVHAFDGAPELGGTGRLAFLTY
jgi:hypothetical protein